MSIGARNGKESIPLGLLWLLEHLWCQKRRGCKQTNKQSNTEQDKRNELKPNRPLIIYFLFLTWFCLLFDLHCRSDWLFLLSLIQIVLPVNVPSGNFPPSTVFVQWYWVTIHYTTGMFPLPPNVVFLNNWSLMIGSASQNTSSSTLQQFVRLVDLLLVLTIGLYKSLLWQWQRKKRGMQYPTIGGNYVNSR